MSELTDQLNSWLTQIISQSPSGTILPTENEIANRFNVCRRTVSQALLRYAQAGKITRIRGKGTFISPVTSPVPPDPKLPVASLFDQLKLFILEGRLKEGEAMPSVKYVTHRFKVTQQTVTNAYRVLEQQKLVFKTGRTYWVGQPHPFSNSQAGEVFIFLSSRTRLQTIYTQGVCPLAYRKMDSVLTDAGFVTRYGEWSQIEALLTEWKRNRSFPRGCVFYDFCWEGLTKVGKYVEDLLNKKIHSTVPVIIDYDEPYVNLPGKPFAISRPMIQKKTVETLAHTIHRFSSLYRRVVCFGHDHPNDVWRFWEIVKFYSKVRQVCPHLAFKVFLKPVYRNRSILRNRIGIQLLSSVAEDAQFDTQSFLGLFDRIENVDQFTKTIRTGDCIVCQYSSDAAAVYDLLKLKSIKIPDMVSIIALENDPAYLDRGISSCIPDEETLGYLMAHAIIGDFPVARDSTGFISCTGKFIKRTSSR